MKVCIENIHWKYEGYAFFFSIESEERLETMRELLEIYIKLNIFKEKIELYWGTNEYFCFSGEDLLGFINRGKDISDEEIEVFNKFGVKGIDIYYRILYILRDHTPPIQYYYNHESDFLNINKKEISRIEPLFIKLFGRRDWKIINTKNNFQPIIP